MNALDVETIAARALDLAERLAAIPERERAEEIRLVLDAVAEEAYVAGRLEARATDEPRIIDARAAARFTERKAREAYRGRRGATR